ncbi:MAG: hypothetical protein C0592_11275 [Marinilabiliales bacterium]|nr:MAG: hypothetical protein C0592_11275 [Marinilabiliales bacterium]
MGLKTKYAGVVAVLLVISFSCGNNKSDNNFQVTPDVVDNKQIPNMQGAITDTEGIFDETEKERLLQKIDVMESEYGLPVCIHTVATFEPFENFTEYSDQVGTEWDYCREDEGILFIISSFLGELRVITCTATETKISDEDFDYMINDILYESFRNDSFEGGLIQAMDFLESIFSTS